MQCAAPRGGANQTPIWCAAVRGVWHPDLKTPFKLTAWITNSARLVMHVNSVADDVTLRVTAGGFISPTVFAFQLVSETGGHYEIQRSLELVSWPTIVVVTNTNGAVVIQDSAASIATAAYRAVGVR